MNVDLKSDSSREIGVDMFNHSNDSIHCVDEAKEDEAQEDEEEDEEDLVEEEAEEECDDGDDDDDDDDDYEDDDDDDDEGNDNEDDRVEDDDCDSNGSNILKVAPREVHINHSSSALRDMSRICWPPGSWHDGTRRSAFQPYRVGNIVVDTDTRIKKGFISAKLSDS